MGIRSIYELSSWEECRLIIKDKSDGHTVDVRSAMIESMSTVSDAAYICEEMLSAIGSVLTNHLSSSVLALGAKRSSSR